MITEASERRQNFRLPMTMDCAINIPNRGFCRCKIRDISEEGAFVAGDTEGLTPDSQVILAVQITKDGYTQVKQFRAVVRYLSATGVGLYIEDARTLLQAAMVKRAQGGGLGSLQQQTPLDH